MSGPTAPSPLARRLRAFGRRLSQAAARLAGRGAVEGFVDGFIAGEIRGWAMDPGAPGRRVHVVAVSEGRIVAEALADLSRADLVQDGRGDGRHAFRLRLPPAFADGAPRKLRVEAVGAGPRTRLLRGELELRPPEAAVAAGARRLPSGSAVDGPAPASPLLVVWGEADDEARARTLESARAQAGPAFDVVELCAGEGARLQDSLASADLVVFARAGDALDPTLGRMLAHTRPLHDVITWDGADAASRRPEARALGVLLGESLGGAFAMRGHVLPGGGRPLLDAMLGADPRQVELLLAARPELRWAHLPARLTARAAKPSLALASGDPVRPAPPGYRWRSGALLPEASPGRWSIGLWPGRGDGAERSLRALLALAPDVAEIELLAEAGAVRGIQDRLGELAAGKRSALAVRPVDLGAEAGAGDWMQALGEAATGEVVLICQAGVELEGRAEALQDLGAWALSPLVGTATAEIRAASASPLAGLAAGRTEAGWAVRSAHDPAQAGRRRPVLGAPAAFLVVARDKLAAVGGFHGARLGQAADLGLALRLRRAGATSVLIGDLAGTWTGPGRPAGEWDGAALAAFDAAELAAAADAFPAPESGA